MFRDSTYVSFVNSKNPYFKQAACEIVVYTMHETTDAMNC